MDAEGRERHKVRLIWAGHFPKEAADYNEAISIINAQLAGETPESVHEPKRRCPECGDRYSVVPQWSGVKCDKCSWQECY